MANILPCIETTSGPKPTAAVIWLHGLGADGNDFAAIVPELDLSGCADIRFVFPHAPRIPVTLNGGYVMPAWYDILGTETQRVEDQAGIRHSALAIQALVEREIERGIPAEKIVLAGFSQGCAMTLLTGLRHPEKLAALVGLSGYLPLAPQTAAERSAANAHTPIFLAHGRSDGVVGIDRARASRDLLLQLGYGIEWHDYPMAHSVCAEEIRDLNAFLLGALGSA